MTRSNLSVRGIVIEPNGEERVVSPWLNPLQAASYLQISRSFLDHLRLKDDGPKYVRIGVKVLYHVEDLDEWASGKK